MFTLGIGLLWLTPYMYTSVAAFYQDVKADFMAKRELAAVPAAPAAPAAVPAETPAQEPEIQAPAIKDVKTENPEDYMPR